MNYTNTGNMIKNKNYDDKVKEAKKTVADSEKTDEEKDEAKKVVNDEEKRKAEIKRLKTELDKDYDNAIAYGKASSAYLYGATEEEKAEGKAAMEKLKSEGFDIKAYDDKRTQMNDLAEYRGKEDGEYKKATNESCRLDEMRKDYQGQCYSCKVVKLLIETFMNASAKVYDLSKEAGTKILFYGFMMWMVAFALKNVSSVTSLEPSNNINDLLIFLFKILAAYVCINGGLVTFTKFVVDPIMITGADYGIGIIDSISAFIGNAPESPVYKYTGAEVISPKVINKIFEVNRAIDYTVSTNLVIGDALICHASNAGAWVDTDLLGFAIRIPNLLLVICGAAIWFCGFMMTLGVSYYLVDISYKIGFTIIILPIVLGLWPFDMVKDKLMTCISIILKSAATFAFLSIMVSYGMVLIDHAYGAKAGGGIDKLFEEISTNKTEWISYTFDITSAYFLILIIAYLYAIKLLGSAIKYTEKFFSDGVFSSSPMHDKLTQITDMAKKTTVGAGKRLAGGAENLARKGLNSFKNNDKQQGGTTMAGNATKSAGNATKNAGKAAQQGGGAMDTAGAAANKGGSALMQSGKGFSTALYGAGAIIGVPMMALGAVMKGGGMAAQATGKATKTAGKAAETAGKTMEKAGSTVNKAWDKTTRATGNKIKESWNSARDATSETAQKGWNSVKNKFKK
ncbi:MAG: hypothetical protein ACK5N8_07055 [Alphaproteobacteria bacterium]